MKAGTMPAAAPPRCGSPCRHLGRQRRAIERISRLQFGTRLTSAFRTPRPAAPPKALPSPFTAVPLQAITVKMGNMFWQARTCRCALGFAVGLPAACPVHTTAHAHLVDASGTAGSGPASPHRRRRPAAAAAASCLQFHTGADHPFPCTYLPLQHLRG